MTWYRLAPFPAAPAGMAEAAATRAVVAAATDRDAASSDRKRFRRAIEASQPYPPGEGHFPGGQNLHSAGEGMPATT